MSPHARFSIEAPTTWTHRSCINPMFAPSFGERSAVCTQISACTTGQLASCGSRWRTGERSTVRTAQQPPRQWTSWARCSCRWTVCRAADTLLRGALATRRKLFGDENDVDRSESDASRDTRCRIATNSRSADSLFREALDIRRGLYGDGDTSVATSRDYLGQLLQAKNANAEALVQYREALAIRTLRLGVDHPATAQTMQNLAATEENLGEVLGR